ncbi:MAG: hypothetical protein IJS02_02330 [Bacteroidales bacterium]|nr:hypothetical protein [Bacteroidales bacterium]
MKRLLFTIAILSSVLPLYSQGFTVKEKDYNEQITEVRRLFDGSTVALKGKFEYQKGKNYLSIKYDNGELFLIDGDKMTIDRDGINQTFDTSKNLMMKSLSNALLYAFQGKLAELAEEQQADMTQTVDKDKNTVVTIAAKTKKVRGYSKIIVYYKPDGTVFKMQMDEFNGASTLYTIN